jgi:uncharacterized protein
MTAGSDPRPGAAHNSDALPLAGRDFHLFDTADGPHLLIVDGSQIFKIDADLHQQLASAGGDHAARTVLQWHGIGLTRYISDEPPIDPPLRALSLAVAQRCNLGCTYCYAEGGSFGRPAQDMAWEVAESAVRRLFAGSKPGERVNLAFLGGEPLTNRPLIRRATELAAEIAAGSDVAVGFSITTNGTLLNEDDCSFFERYAFSVTVSLDGIAPMHDRLRPTKGGRGSYDRVIANARPLLERQRRMQVAARVTVTPVNVELRRILDHFASLGFHSVGFSPMLSAPSGRHEMSPPDLEVLLDQMIDCGREFERRVASGQSYPFANMIAALEEIHRGTHRPYPCGAGAGYFGVSASGGLFACHRFVEDHAATMGHVDHGVDRDRQRRWLADRVVERQEPCRNCWARYLCGGGCHYEVIHRGRPACDYIRGWLDFVLGAYVRLSTQNPDLFKGVRGRAGSLKGLGVASD